MSKFIIIDLDGSLCNDSHRRHLAVARKWDEYHAACVHDEPNEYVADLIRHTARHNNIEKVFITGRDAKFESDTRIWIGIESIHISYLYMRPTSDRTTPNIDLKANHLAAYLLASGKKISDCLFAIEDKPAVVDMWKALGIPVVQIHQKGIVTPI